MLVAQAAGAVAITPATLSSELQTARDKIARGLARLGTLTEEDLAIATVPREEVWREDMVRLSIWPQSGLESLAALEPGQWLSALGLVDPAQAHATRHRRRGEVPFHSFSVGKIDKPVVFEFGMESHLQKPAKGGNTHLRNS